MIVGIDVYHEKGKQLSSVVGFVASMDKTFTQWYSVAGMQKSTHQELMKSIQTAFHKVLHQYKSVSIYSINIHNMYIIYICIYIFSILICFEYVLFLEKWFIT